MRDYETDFWDQDRAMQLLCFDPGTRMVRDSTLIDDAERRRPGFYSDYLGRIGAARGLYASVMHWGGEVVVISAQRPKQAGDYTPCEGELISVLLPHLRRSFRISEKIKSRDAEAVTLTGSFEHASAAVLLVDRSFRLHFANKVAERFLAKGILRVAGQRLVAATGELTDRLRRAVTNATDPVQARPDHFSLLDTPVPARCGQMPQILVAPVAARRAGVGPGDGLAMLVVYEQIGFAEGAACKSSYNLTAAETRLLSALVAGERLRDYAARTCVSISTVKTHLRNLFAKTGEQRQADLVRRALSDPVLRRMIVPETMPGQV
jgi:DNA-binding CsgD family transcriptional regulator